VGTGRRRHLTGSALNPRTYVARRSKALAWRSCVLSAALYPKTNHRHKCQTVTGTSDHPLRWAARVEADRTAQRHRSRLPDASRACECPWPPERERLRSRVLFRCLWWRDRSLLRLRLLELSSLLLLLLRLSLLLLRERERRRRSCFDARASPCDLVLRPCGSAAAGSAPDGANLPVSLRSLVLCDDRCLLRFSRESVPRCSLEPWPPDSESERERPCRPRPLLSLLPLRLHLPSVRSPAEALVAVAVAGGNRASAVEPCPPRFIAAQYSRSVAAAAIAPVSDTIGVACADELLLSAASSCARRLSAARCDQHCSSRANRFSVSKLSTVDNRNRFCTGGGGPCRGASSAVLAAVDAFEAASGRIGTRPMTFATSASILHPRHNSIGGWTSRIRRRQMAVR